MNSIFDKLYTNENGNPAPLPPLQGAMQYQYEVKQTNTIDSSTVLPYNQMNAEMFYPVRQENVDTTAILWKTWLQTKLLQPFWVNFVTQRKLFQIMLLQSVASSARVKLRMRSIWRVLVKMQPMILRKVRLHS